MFLHFLCARNVFPLCSCSIKRGMHLYYYFPFFTEFHSKPNYTLNLLRTVGVGALTSAGMAFLPPLKYLLRVK
uniref:Uncharacterized protein n=1 Tax=Arundo donax TaxID=35708 RepID=A0A0A9AFF0_ARUDO